MSLLTFTKLEKSYGARDVFLNLSGSIEQGARIGLIGPNGVGKTTFIKALLGVDAATAGDVHRARGLRVGYLSQTELGGSGIPANHTLWAEMQLAFTAIQQLAARLAALAAELHQGDPAILAEYGALQLEFEQMGGYDYEIRMEQTLRGLGFLPQHHHLPLNKLSGGQKTRARLARLLLEAPDLLFLDEPTNHLDVQAIEWLENWLNAWSGSALIVSHDRYFLDRVVNRIWELGPAQLEAYRGNYSDYLRQREARWEQRQLFYDTEKARMLKELEYIRRNIAGQNTSQAKGKLRRLSREVEAAEQLGLEALKGKQWAEVVSELDNGVGGRLGNVEEVARRINGLRDPLNRPTQLRLRLQATGRAGDQVLITQNLQVGYPGAPLFNVPDLVLRRGEFVALIGANGSGKSTLLKTLLEQLPPCRGRFTWGASLQVAYFSQAHEGLNPQNTLIAEIESVSELRLGEIRDYLAQFLFSGDDVFKTVDMLSGGERGRLALAKLALTKANLLLLDEPTNHLDIPAQEVLQAVLEQFSGTVILVSHDRYLINQLASQIWAILGSQLTIFPGRYAEFLAKQSQNTSVPNSPTPKDNTKAAPPAARSDLREQRQAKKDAAKRADRLAQLEQRVADLEQQLTMITTQLEIAGVAQANEKIWQLGQAYEQTQAQLVEAMSDWETLAAGDS
jgi:ATP-binding cassette subfamily F protein 3